MMSRTPPQADIQQAVKEQTTRSRLAQFALIGGMLAFSWLCMQAVHEAGHVLSAWATGGRVTIIVLHPLQISRTDVAPNPSPGLVVWSGPLFGILAPLLAWLFVRGRRWSWDYLVRFFAGFCLVANGAYIGSGVLMPVGDALTMRQHGSPAWLLALFGAATTPTGLWLWHRQGRYFGLGPQRCPVNQRHALAVVVLLTFVVMVELAIS